MRVYDGLIWVIVGCVTTFTEWVKIELTLLDNTFIVPGIVLILIGFIVLLFAANAKIVELMERK